MKLRSLVLTGLLLSGATAASAQVSMRIVDPAVKVTAPEAGMMRAVTANPRLAGLATALRAENASGRLNLQSPAAARSFMVDFAKKQGMGADVIALLPTVAEITAAQTAKVSLATSATESTSVASDLDLLNGATGSCDLTAAVAPSSIVAAAGSAVSVAEVQAAESTLASTVNALQFNGLTADIAANFAAMVETSMVEGQEGHAALVKGIQIATEHGGDAVSARAAQALKDDGVIDSAEADVIQTCFFTDGLTSALSSGMDPAAASAQAMQIGAACSVETAGKALTVDQIAKKCAA